MKLKPILIPTEDASAKLQWVDESKTLHLYPNNAEDWNDLIDNLGSKRHLYLTSDAPIKKGEWAIASNNTNGVITDFNGCKPFIAKYDYAGSIYVLKILFTTDPKLTQCDGKCAKNECVCDLVPAIDGNTKARIYLGVPKYGFKDSSEAFYEVNFLTEFCKRWNEKDKKGCQFDTDNDGNCQYHPNGCPNQKDNQKVENLMPIDIKELSIGYKYLVEFDKDNTLKFIYWREDYYKIKRAWKIDNQALQSQAGCFNTAIEFGKWLSIHCSDKCDDFNAPDGSLYYFNSGEHLKTIEQLHEIFIQSLTKKTPKEDIVIEYNEETKTLIFSQ